MNNCVYKFMNRDGEVIYIGKAKDLSFSYSIVKNIKMKIYRNIKCKLN